MYLEDEGRPATNHLIMDLDRDEAMDGALTCLVATKRN